jgi:hypothetical protein
MSDIVDTLLDWSEYDEGKINDAREKAANEIKRLRAENERLRAGLRNAYEVHAGSDGFIPETAAEGYLQRIIKQMVDCISAALDKRT